VNFQELNNLLSTLLADSSSNFYTGTERAQALNQACAYMNGELRILQTTKLIAHTPLESVVAMPEDFVAMSRDVNWIPQTGPTTNLQYKPLMQLRESNALWQGDLGDPTTYTLDGGRILLYPKPRTAGTVQLSYIAMPNRLLDDDDLPFYGDPRIQSYHEMIAFYAAWLLCMKDRDFEASDKFMQYFQVRMIDLKENLRHVGGITQQPVWSDTYAIR